MRIALTILTIASSILSTHAQLVISACCGDVGHCKNYTSIDELIGVSCCGHQPINRFTQICCQNTVRERRHGPVYYDACCGNETVTNKQTCCGNVVHDVANADCCGSQPFDRNDKSTLCCDGVLTHGNPPGSTCCGREPYDGGLSEICCGGRVFRKCRFDSCCLSNNGTFIAFASTTHSCCDEPIARRGNLACCYLRVNDRLLPTPYNTISQRCKYPYMSIVATLP